MLFKAFSAILGRLKLFQPLLAGLSLGLGGQTMAAESKILPGHVPSVVNHLKAVGTLPWTNHLDLAIGLPLRQTNELQAFLDRLYDPASPDYRHYLTPEQFADRFGPTLEDYQAVTAFARQNHLAVRSEHGNRLVLDVSGSVADIQSAFHLTLKIFHHPKEARDFYAPDTEPTVDASLPIADISGLNNLTRPHPAGLNLISPAANQFIPKTGSGPTGSFMGTDFRAAYLPGVSLTGTGQSLGLVEFSGYVASDISAYENKAGLAAVPLVNANINYNGAATSDGDVEVSADIEMAVSMAPGLARIVIFDAGPNGIQNDVLEAMVASNTISQFSCSWGWGGGPNSTTDSIFKEMMAQGQTFFNASGDSDAFSIGSNSANGVDNTSLYFAPSSCPYITQVGGTTLKTSGPGGAWASETVWNWGLQQSNYLGSSGGVSTYYAIPTWQQNVSMSANGGNSYFRNIPDVAANADNVYVIYGGGVATTNLGGTSCAAPLWGALAAVINQQSLAAGGATIGFLNTALYTLGRGTNYSASFHDITTGNNEWPGSPKSYSAVTGYDLCTGWGTPAGQSLINGLAGSGVFKVTPNVGFYATGWAGGPFNTNSKVFTLANNSSSSTTWAVINLPTWLTPSVASGTLAAQASGTVTISLNATANTLPPGTYASSISFTNSLNTTILTFAFGLQVNQQMSAQPTNGLTATGPVAGPFTLTSSNLTLVNLGSSPLKWNLGPVPAWLALTPTNGTLAANGTSTLTASLSATVKSLPGGVYSNTLTVYDFLGRYGPALPAVLQVGQSIVQNGGFETGTFTNWTVVGSTNTDANVYNAVESTSSQYPLAVHTGTYGAFLGDTRLATLSQNLATVPGASYLVSFWLDNPVSGAAQQFRFGWITNSATAGQIYYVTNPPVLAWTNFLYVLTATGTNTIIQFGAENIPDFFGVDDVSAIPIPAPNPGITSLSRSGNSVSLTWYTVTGLSYQLLYTTNLAPAVWVPVSTNTASATTLTLTNNPGANRQRFYRLRQLPL